MLEIVGRSLRLMLGERYNVSTVAALKSVTKMFACLKLTL